MWWTVTPSSLLITELRHWGLISWSPCGDLFVLIINPLQAILDTETDFSQPGQVCVRRFAGASSYGAMFWSHAEEVMSHSRMGFNINWLIIFGGCLVLSVFIANFAS